MADGLPIATLGFAEARAWLKGNIEGRRIMCELLRRDQYGRVVALPLLPRIFRPWQHCRRWWAPQGGSGDGGATTNATTTCNLPLEMVRAGWGVVYTALPPLRGKSNWENWKALRLRSRQSFRLQEWGAPRRRLDGKEEEDHNVRAGAVNGDDVDNGDTVPTCVTLIPTGREVGNSRAIRRSDGPRLTRLTRKQGGGNSADLGSRRVRARTHKGIELSERIVRCNHHRFIERYGEERVKTKKVYKT